jgi:hypothetical protein
MPRGSCRLRRGDIQKRETSAVNTLLSRDRQSKPATILALLWSSLRRPEQLDHEPSDRPQFDPVEETHRREVNAGLLLSLLQTRPRSYRELRDVGLNADAVSSAFEDLAAAGHRLRRDEMLTLVREGTR